MPAALVTLTVAGPRAVSPGIAMLIWAADMRNSGAARVTPLESAISTVGPAGVTARFAKSPPIVLTSSSGGTLEFWYPAAPATVIGVSTPDSLAAWLASPEYMAVCGCTAVLAHTVAVATPLDSAALAKITWSIVSRNCTVPPDRPEPGGSTWTLALSRGNKVLWSPAPFCTRARSAQMAPTPVSLNG